MASLVGLRVLRGPDWNNSDVDGGEGHLGTVISLLENSCVKVMWDNGKESTCRAGTNGKFDLRIFDSAPIGIRHADTTCSACEERDFYGMLWRCKECRSCSLCALCYIMDKHDLRHEFLRYDRPGSSGESVKKRSVSLKIRAMGFFPGATVKRGKDWAWGDQDGGIGSTGKVVGFENVAPDSSRNVIRVEWENGNSNSYRIGFKGHVDLTCVEEIAGMYYYKDHLPVLNTVGASIGGESALGNTSPRSYSQTSLNSSGATNAALSVDINVKVGDKVAIAVNEDKLKELQVTCGGCSAGMLKCIGKSGEVVSFAVNGATTVKFEKMPAFRFNPKALVKIPQLKVGDIVRIRSDMQQVKVLNLRIAWKPEMEKFLGKVGRVTKIDSDGDVVVIFDRQVAIYSPACCIPAPGAALDSFESVTSSGTGNSSSSDISNPDDASSPESEGYGDLHQALIKMLAQMLIQGGGGKSDTEIDRLFRAVARGDTQSVRSICQNNRSLLNYVHKGLTPLIVACHEGQQEALKVLLELGAEINRQGSEGNTPLGAAIEGKKESVALFLLEKGADPHLRNSKQRNFVHLAAYNNQADIIKMLAQKGADVNAKDMFGDTPLHDAIDQDSRNAVDMLLKLRSLDAQATNRKSFNFLQFACLKGNAYAVERILLRDASQVNALQDGQFAALHIAATNDHVDCIRLLVTDGKANVNIVGQKGLTPLHLACIRAFFSSMEALLELGAQVNVRDNDGDTPLHVVLGTRVDNPNSPTGIQEQKQRARMACVLLSRGSYPDISNKKGGEPLQCCPHDGIRRAVQEFMKQNPSLIQRQKGTSGGGMTARGHQGSGLEALLQGLQGLAMPCGGCMGPSDITLMPCGHKTLCQKCCLKTSECPLCDATIERRLLKRSVSGSGDSVEELCKQM